MNTFTLKTGSEFEMVDATYRISRVLGHSEVVCENVETGDVIKMSVLQVSQAVESSALVVNDRMKGEAATCTTSMQQLSSEKVLYRTNRKIGYVRHIRHYEPNAVSGLKIERLVSEAAKALGDIAPPSARNVTRWLKKYDQDQSLAIPTRRRVAGKNNLSRALAVQSLDTHYLSKDQETLADCYDRYLVDCGHAGQRPISISSFRRVLISDFSKYEVIEKRYSKTEAKKRFRTPFKVSSPERPYQKLELDHTILDWVVLSDDRSVVIGRPTLVCILDVATKYVVAAYLSFLPPSVQTVMGALKMAFFPKNMEDPEFMCLTEPWLGFGLPETLIVDNGLENHSHALSGLFQHMGLAINLEFCATRSPWQKPHVERFFAAAATFLKSHAGRVTKPRKGETQTSTDESAVLTFSELRSFLYRWVEEIHNKTPHSRTKLIPRVEFEAGMRSCPPFRIPVSAELFDFCATREIHRTVGPHGVSLHGLTYGGHNLHELKKRTGEKFSARIRYSPENLSNIYVFDTVRKEWLKAFCTDQKYSQNLSLAEHKSIMRFRDHQLANSGSRKTLVESRVRLLNDIRNSVRSGKRLKLSSKHMLEKHVKGVKPTLIEQEIDRQVEEISLPDFSFDPRTISNVKVIQELR